MIRDIVKDTEVLQRPCSLVVKSNIKEAADLIQNMKDTAEFYKESKGCVGLAANQVGSNLRVILVRGQDNWTVMINPSVTRHGKESIMSEEGCLSLEGVRTVKRWNTVEVVYFDTKLRVRKQVFTGFSATVVQHEIDHLNGKLI